MEVITLRDGKEEIVEVAEDRIFEFARGLNGFEHHHRYALIPDEDSSIEWLQSLDDPAVCFPLLEPFLFYPEYAFDLPDHDAEALGLEGPQDATVRAVITIREDPEQATANLLAPVVLNMRTGLGRQVLLQDSSLPICFELFEALQLTAEAA